MSAARRRWPLGAAVGTGCLMTACVLNPIGEDPSYDEGANHSPASDPNLPDFSPSGPAAPGATNGGVPAPSASPTASPTGQSPDDSGPIIDGPSPEPATPTAAPQPTVPPPQAGGAADAGIYIEDSDSGGASPVLDAGVDRDR